MRNRKVFILVTSYALMLSTKTKKIASLHALVDVKTPASPDPCNIFCFISFDHLQIATSEGLPY